MPDQSTDYRIVVLGSAGVGKCPREGQEKIKVFI